MGELPHEPFEREIDRALADYLGQCDQGDIPERQQFLDQYSPDLRARLTELLAAADWIEQQAGPSVAELSRRAAQQAGSDQSALRGQPLGDTVPLVSANRPTASSTQRPSTISALPYRFGDYELQRVIGRGGMGVVYFARQIQLDRPVAVKMIRSGALASEEEVQRFYAEARSAAQLNHPSIVTVYQCGECEGHHYFSMDFVEGTDLEKLTQHQPLDGPTAARYVRDAARAIQFAHERGILHRDLKPANILVDQQDQIRITDFGLAKNVGLETGLTVSGAALGTPSYMSPEQAAGHTAEHRQATDIYALGAILFALLAGQPPFKGDNVIQTLLQVLHRPAPRLRSLRRDISPDLETIVDICLQKAPGQRYASADALADDLDRAMHGLPIAANPIPWWRRWWYWLLGIPVIGAILDHRVVEPTATHRWVQRGMIIAGGLMLLAWFTLLIQQSNWFKNRLPSIVRVAAGAEGGDYSRVAEALAAALKTRVDSPIELWPSQGSAENIEHLAAGRVHLALLQADVVGDSDLAVVAPLYHEVVHLLAAPGQEFVDLAQLRGKRIFVGRAKAGSRATALRLLEYSGVSSRDVELIEGDWQRLADVQAFDAAILVARRGSAEIDSMLGSGQLRLMNLRDAWEFALAEPSFHPITVKQLDYPAASWSGDGINTVATTAFLVCSQDAPEVLVHQVLYSLYSPPLRNLGILSAEQAAHWQGIAWHPAARAFFSAYRGR